MFFVRRPYLAPVIILFAVSLLYGWFLNSPIQFDDFNNFMPGAPGKFPANLGVHPRHLTYVTLILSWDLFGTGIVSLRVTSLLMHAGVAIALFFFLRQIQQVMKFEIVDNSAVFLSLLAALVFALHPVAVYGAAYLIQRTIVMATLFSILSWWFFLRGLEKGMRAWLWAGVAMYALAVLCKEHAVMVPAINAVLAIWWWRTQIVREKFTLLMQRLGLVLVSYFLITLWVVLQPRETFGSVYELDALDMLRSIPQWAAWPLSVITQGTLFFKYLVLWILPNPVFMSVDMRETFTTSFAMWPQLLGFIVFLIWPCFAGYLVWKGGRRGLLGFAMLAPWLLFATELTTVRVQEVFVLYRSYLWVPPAFCVILLLQPLLKIRTISMLLLIVPIILFPLSWDRLKTFSHPLLLWDDAMRLIEIRHDLDGLTRIYYNRGMAWHALKRFDLAIADYTVAINSRKNIPTIYVNRGSALLELKRYKEALTDFDFALTINPKDAFALTGRGIALTALDKPDDARLSFQAACPLGSNFACNKIKETK
ncbi:hypothetical protein BH11PSE12_BH11PSE12_24890 [soil metagenome]